MNVSDQTFYNHFAANIHFFSKLSRKARTEMYEMFMREIAPGPQTTILDIGVSVTEQERLEENILEQLYPYKENITMVGIHEGRFLESVYSGAKYVQHIPGSPRPFADHHFDACYCNAVLEHVGEEESQCKFIAEVLRVTKKLFLTTPNRAYPVDFHKMLPFLHWLPMNAYRKIISWMGDEFYSKKENLNLLFKNDLKRLMQNQGVEFRIVDYWWMGLPAHLIVVAKK